MTDTVTDNWTQVRIDIGELKGILNTTVVTQGEKINDLASKQEIQRRDMDSVKDTLTEKINTVNTKAETNRNEIANIRDDMKQVQEKQNASFGKVALALSLVLSLIGIFWNVVSRLVGG